LDPANTDKNRFNWGAFNSTYFQDQITNDNTFQGIYQDYDNSGYNYTIDINNGARFNKTMKDLIDVRIY
jgi:hypothetical protein